MCGGELPLRAEALRSMSLSFVGSTTGNSPMGDEGLWEKSIALIGEAVPSSRPIKGLAGVGVAGSGVVAGDGGASSRLRLSRRAQTLPDCTDLKQFVSRSSMCAHIPPDCADPNKLISRAKIRDDASMADSGT
jgi:hypothetical protein